MNITASLKVLALAIITLTLDGRVEQVHNLEFARLRQREDAHKEEVRQPLQPSPPKRTKNKSRAELVTTTARVREGVHASGVLLQAPRAQSLKAPAIDVPISISRSAAPEPDFALPPVPAAPAPPINKGLQGPEAIQPSRSIPDATTTRSKSRDIQASEQPITKEAASAGSSSFEIKVSETPSASNPQSNTPEGATASATAADAADSSLAPA